MKGFRRFLAFWLARFVVVDSWVSTLSPLTPLHRSEPCCCSPAKFDFIREARRRSHVNTLHKTSFQTQQLLEISMVCIRCGFEEQQSNVVKGRRVINTLGFVMLLLLTGFRLCRTNACAASVTAVHGSAESLITAAPTLMDAAVVAKPLLAYGGPTVSMATEIRLSLRLIAAALIGGLVGWERSSTRHATGVRTLSLVSMAAAAYTVCSSFGFLGFPRVDPSRMASNVASGVGFIGAGVITTSTLQHQQRQDEHNNGISKLSPSALSVPNTVHGLTTAAAIWLSAAVGVACGVGLYIVATTAALTTITVLRLGRVKQHFPFEHRRKSATSGESLRRQQTASATQRKQQLGEENELQKKLGEKYVQDTTLTGYPCDPNLERRALEFIDAEMELAVLSGWKNATDSETSFRTENNSNLSGTSETHPKDVIHP